jgi:hypothetical protein
VHAVDAAGAVRLYRQWLPDTDLYRDLSELAGHDLMCFCPLERPCHADVLLELANTCHGRVSEQLTKAEGMVTGFST